MHASKPQPNDDASSQPKALELRRDLLKTAIADIQGSIHANDSKCSAALVVHGLLFAGTVSVVSRLGTIWTDASGSTQTVAAIILAIGAAMLVLSIAALLWALKPYSPSKQFLDPILAVHEPPSVFFPDLRSPVDGNADRLTLYRKNLDRIDSPLTLDLELSFELLKVQDIRAHEARYASIGFALLMVEIVAAIAFLTMMGFQAL